MCAQSQTHTHMLTHMKNAPTRTPLGGAVVRPLPANVRDILGPGGFHKPGSNWAHVLHLLKPIPRAYAPQQEKPPQPEACAPQWRVPLYAPAPLTATRESLHKATKSEGSQIEIKRKKEKKSYWVELYQLCRKAKKCGYLQLSSF